MADFARFDQLLTAAGAPVAALPHRAADRATVDAACATAGVTAVEGLYEWFGWRNIGSVIGGTLQHAMLVGRMATIEMDLAVALHAQHVAATVGFSDDEFPFPSGWFPILIGADSSGVVCVNCDEQLGSIVLYDPVVERPATLDDRIADSVDELVDRYIVALERGWVYGPHEEWSRQFRLDLAAEHEWVYTAL